MPNKFTIGDKVTIRRRNNRTPNELLGILRLDHPRTIVATFYDPKTQHTRYYLGNNRRGKVNPSDFHFRASQLKLWNRGKIGRPKTKRHYNSPYSKPPGVLGVNK